MFYIILVVKIYPRSGQNLPIKPTMHYREKHALPPIAIIEVQRAPKLFLSTKKPVDENMTKIFLNDTGLLCHKRGESVDSLIANMTTAGAFLENFIVMEIIMQLSWSELFLKPYHFSVHIVEPVI